ncbi:MAG: mammalian cell entry protein, partial [Mycobacterium sp.]|nr:mammalian cell entry protein [Mycobacterium sp.]
GLGLIAAVGAVLVAAGLATSAGVFAAAQATHRAEIREAAVLSFVRSFITQYTSPDPFHANAYADKVLELGTGNFAQLYGEMMNEVVIQVAQAEPGFGTVQELGIERWNPNGSATVVAVANMTTKMPDGKKIESGSRWEVTAVKEGGQWKVSDLIQVL